MKVGGFSKRVTTTLTRPADTTQYGAGDQVADSTSAPTAITFSGIGRTDGGTGLIVHALCIDSAAQATKPNFRLYLFSASPTMTNDNSAWAPTDAVLNTVIGCIEFSSWEVGTSTAGAGGNCFALGVTPNGGALSIPYQCVDGTTAIYGCLVERGTYTPVSGEIFKFSLGVLAD